MKILGIHCGHNATVSLLKDGKVIFCQSEERLNRLKNSSGFPFETVKYIYDKFGNDIDLAVFSSRFIQHEYRCFKNNGFKSVKISQGFQNARSLSGKILIKYILWKYFRKLSFLIFKMKYNQDLRLLENDTAFKNEALTFFSKALNLSQDKLVFLDHHTSHALSPCFNMDFQKEVIIFTLDGGGDHLCGSVNMFRRGELKNLAKVQEFNSIGFLWYEMAVFMGMQPLEDEFKIMGLASYAKRARVLRVYKKLKEALWLNEKNEFKSAFPSSYLYYLENFIYERFDDLAGGIQMFTEEIVGSWIEGWIKKTGIRKIALSGGLFMNVKLNQRIASLDSVREVFIMPSAGDESTVFGSVFYGYKKYCQEKGIPFKPKSFQDLYLGMNFTEKDIKKYLNENKIGEKYKVVFFENIEKRIARLLSQNDIVARFKGPMEFGARTLGNRSILANPSNFNNVKIINDMIKNRDFWMPFAPSILEEEAERYIINPKKIKAPYMMITFDTTELGRKHLVAAIHQHDFTTRPQIVSKEWNPSYHYLIQEFKKLTGIGAVLNTSFNLHGEPIVCSPEDAFKVFDNSGLKYLALGNFLIEKK